MEIETSVDSRRFFRDSGDWGLLPPESLALRLFLLQLVRSVGWSDDVTRESGSQLPESPLSEVVGGVLGLMTGTAYAPPVSNLAGAPLEEVVVTSMSPSSSALLRDSAAADLI